MSADLTYPNVTCSTHPEPAPGYIVCVHVIAGAPIAQYRPATPWRLGDVLCAHCPPADRDTVYLLRVWCAGCVDGLLAERAPQP